jgi:hypothetical protein
MSNIEGKKRWISPPPINSTAYATQDFTFGVRKLSHQLYPGKTNFEQSRVHPFSTKDQDQTTGNFSKKIRLAPLSVKISDGELKNISPSFRQNSYNEMLSQQNKTSRNKFLSQKNTTQWLSSNSNNKFIEPLNKTSRQSSKPVLVSNQLTHDYLLHDRGIAFDGTFDSMRRTGRITIYRAKIAPDGLNTTLMLELQRDQNLVNKLFIVVQNP